MPDYVFTFFQNYRPPKQTSDWRQVKIISLEKLTGSITTFQTKIIDDYTFLFSLLYTCLFLPKSYLPFLKKSLKIYFQMLLTRLRCAREVTLGNRFRLRIWPWHKKPLQTILIGRILWLKFKALWLARTKIDQSYWRVSNNSVPSLVGF